MSNLLLMQSVVCLRRTRVKSSRRKCVARRRFRLGLEVSYGIFGR